MSMFPVDTRLLDPLFEQYRLSGSESEVHQHVYPLDTPATARHALNSSVGYKDVKARAQQNALAPARASGQQLARETRCAYIDAEGWITVVVIDASLSPTFHRVHQLVLSDAQVPTIRSLGADTWVAIGDGATLVVANEAGLQGTLPIPIAADAQRWEVIDAAPGANPLVLLQNTRRTRSDGGASTVSTDGSADAATHTELDVALVCVHADAARVDVLWHVTGDEPVRFCVLEAEYVALGAEGTFHVAAAAGAGARTDDSSHASGATDTHALTSVPGADAVGRNGSAGGADAPARSYSFRWTQTDDTVILTFSLPADIRKDAIRVHFSPQGLSLSLAQAAVDASEDTLVRRIAEREFSSRRLWGSIDPTASVCEWDGAPDGPPSPAAALSLHLAKAHEGTRWPSVFAGEDLPHHDDPPEALDAAQLRTTVEGLSKYTTSDPAAHRGHASLLSDGLEEEDALTGTPTFLTTIARTATGWQPCDDADRERALLLARPLPSNDVSNSVLMKHDVDGLVFAPTAAQQPWTHTETVPAISYVLASKRDANPVYLYPRHTDGSLVLAIEARRETSAADPTMSRAGNLYMYSVHDPPRSTSERVSKPKYGTGRVLRLGTSTDAYATGIVRGAAMLAVGDTRVFTCLCERALLLLEGVA